MQDDHRLARQSQRRRALLLQLEQLADRGGEGNRALQVLSLVERQRTREEALWVATQACATLAEEAHRAFRMDRPEASAAAWQCLQALVDAIELIGNGKVEQRELLNLQRPKRP